jgi:hypothetical protein
MIIYAPTKEIKDNKVYLNFKFELRSKPHTLWFSFPIKYENYLVTENADAALAALLLLAMYNGENIDVQAPISARLYYQLNHYVINALNLANSNWKLIKVKVKETNEQSLNINTASGTGISCGVDSFATIVDHLSENNDFNIEYFTFFNAGSHGNYGGEKARELFNERLELVKPFIEEINKSLIEVDTNLNEILMMEHHKTHTIRDIACVLNLQKLFKNYYYASAYRFDHYRLNELATSADYDLLILTMFSTESTTFYSSVTQYTRLERTKLITEYTPTYKYLNVCVHSSITGEAKNCSSCNKCMRTQLTLDLLEKYYLYKEIFDFNIYMKNKSRYIGQIIYEKKNNSFSQEIYDLLIEKKSHVTLTSYLYFLFLAIKHPMIQLLKNVFNTSSSKGKL